MRTEVEGGRRAVKAVLAHVFTVTVLLLHVAHQISYATQLQQTIAAPADASTSCNQKIQLAHAVNRSRFIKT